MLDESLYTSESIDSWKKLLEWYDENKDKTQWVFRGHKDSEWEFKTSLERAIATFKIDARCVPKLEIGLLRYFKRQSHHYMVIPPEEENVMEWLALMQHYGAPTRLLDWTHSLFVAVYFAVEFAEKECAVWAIDHAWLIQTVESVLSPVEWNELQADRNVKKERTFNDVFGRNSPIPLVCPIKPYRFNDRLIIQQGLFLCPGDISISFEENLRAFLSKPFSKNKLVKLTIKNDPDLRKDILQNLHRMNMNSATLFPGWAGFAQSLRTLLVFPDILRP